jgi:hypothetical protein
LGRRRPGRLNRRPRGTGTRGSWHALDGAGCWSDRSLTPVLVCTSCRQSAGSGTAGPSNWPRPAPRHRRWHAPRTQPAAHRRRRAPPTDGAAPWILRAGPIPAAGGGFGGGGPARPGSRYTGPTRLHGPSESAPCRRRSPRGRLQQLDSEAGAPARRDRRAGATPRRSQPPARPAGRRLTAARPSPSIRRQSC